MAKPQRRPVLAPSTMASLPGRAAEALEQRRFREAIDLFKQLVRQEPRPEWKAALDDAYCGRAHALAAKQMFKEAAMVLENTRAPDGGLREPLLYARCLIQQGQQAKAASHLLHTVCGEGLAASERPAVEAMLAALLIAFPLPPAPLAVAPPAEALWRAGAAAAREALAAWMEGAAAEEVERLLGRISLRSAFRPLRLLLKSLVAGPEGAERNRALLETIAPGSAFFPFRQAVEAALDAGLSADAWKGLTPAQQGFVAETGGLEAASIDALAKVSAAAGTGPAALFETLQKWAASPQTGRHAPNLADLRLACLNLLPEITDRVGVFEKQFGRLSALERARIDALAAESDEAWAEAKGAWLRAARAIAEAGSGRVGDFSRAVIFRHIAALADRHPYIEDGEDDDAVSFYLRRASEADPEHIPTMLARIARYRSISRDQDWHRVAEEAVARFPQDSQVLLAATQSAVAREAYKKAAGFARRLLAIDPINPGLRRQMVELQVAQARKQIRAKRPDLAARALAEAAQWERADAPDSLLRIYNGLVALQEDRREAGEALVREGVELAGGGAAGWFRAVLEGDLVKIRSSAVSWLRAELGRARQTKATKACVQAVVSALGSAEAVAGMRSTKGAVGGMHSWLAASGSLDWSVAEFQALEDTLVRYAQFDVLEAIARAGRLREPGNRQWRFHEILARTHNEPGRMTVREEDEIEAIGRAASERNDAHTLTRLRRYLQINERMSGGGRRGAVADFEDMDDLDFAEALQMMLAMKGAMPKDMERDVRAQVGRVGREAAAADMAAMLANDPDGPHLPKAMARKIADMLIKSALAGGGKPGRGARL